MQLKKRVAASKGPAARPDKDALRKRAMSALDRKAALLSDEPINAVGGGEKEAANIDWTKVRSRMDSVIKLSSYDPPAKFVLQTGSKDLNRVLGSEEVGIPYGKVIELSGLEHGGKTLLGSILMGMAQKDSAACGYIDNENSSDELWMTALGVDFGQVMLIEPKLVTPVQKGEDGKKKKTKMKASDPARIQGAEELFAEAEAAMAAFYEQGVEKQFWLLDSLANLITIKQVEAGTTGQSMNTNLDLSVVLARTLPKWAGLARNYNAMIVIVNQLRNKIGISWGDPFDTPGGRAARHAFSNRTRVKRLKNGMLRQAGHVTGLVGILDNTKNKMGLGSRQSEKCGFKVSWRTKGHTTYEFMSVKDAEDLIKGEG